MKSWIFGILLAIGLNGGLLAGPACLTCALNVEGIMVCYENYVEIRNEPIKPTLKTSKDGEKRPCKDAAASRRKQSSLNKGGSGELLGDLAIPLTSKGTNNIGWESFVPPTNIFPNPLSTA